MVAERTQLETLDVLRDGGGLHAVRDGVPGCFLLEDDLSLLVKLGALLDVRRLLRLDDEIVERLVAPASGIAAADGCCSTAEEGEEEVVRIAVVAGPSELRRHRLARLDPLAVLAPFEGGELGR